MACEHGLGRTSEHGLSTLLSLGAAYALSRFRFKGRGAILNIALILGMFPGFMAMIAVYLILNMLGLINHPFALLLVYSSGAGLNFYVSKGYFDTIPYDLDEAAMIDGAIPMADIFKGDFAFGETDHRLHRFDGLHGSLDGFHPCEHDSEDARAEDGRGRPVRDDHGKR